VTFNINDNQHNSPLSLLLSEYRFLYIIMLNVILLSVIMLDVVMLSVMEPLGRGAFLGER